MNKIKELLRKIAENSRDVYLEYHNDGSWSLRDLYSEAYLLDGDISKVVENELEKYLESLN